MSMAEEASTETHLNVTKHCGSGPATQGIIEYVFNLIGVISAPSAEAWDE
jgi:hypothetical protein